MTISKDLFLAILSMDSYNRGYDVGIQGLGGLNSEIGNARIISQSDTINGSAGVSAGFYGLAYNTSSVSGFSSGEKTVAYRGTNADTVANLLTDAWNGYGVGAGSPAGKQAELALGFYQNIAGASAYSPA